MKRLTLIILFSLTCYSTNGYSCEVGKPCGDDKYCLNVDKDKTECRDVPKTFQESLILPFQTSVEVICTHSFGVGSHSWTNAFYALDLATKYDDPAPYILAAAGGKAFVFPKGELCKNPKGAAEKAEIDSCGIGWGNNIKILHADGYYSFYVHLDKVLIKDGQVVKQGDVLGTMGWTGQAGHRHLHWSVNQLPGSTPEEWQKQISWDGESVPFEFEATLNGTKQIVNSSTLNCPHANIGQIKNQPVLKRSE